jgi:ankyrin repeat protein
VQRLLREGANVHQVDKWGWTALHYAAFKPHPYYRS